MKVLITGTAGFIGSHVAAKLLERGDEVIGVDNLNTYYDPKLKEARLARLTRFPNFVDVRADIADRTATPEVFAAHKPSRVVHLAAQAGVRYSLTHPEAYVDTNLVGFGNILEACRHNRVEHLVYASSSSVYGANTTLPFSVHHNVDHPLSLYAATKKANELMAHTYSSLFDLPTTGLRFFTVYGPWGRPDMALFLFTRKILADEPIDVFNYGNHTRGFTYIDDIAEGVVRVLDRLRAAERGLVGRGTRSCDEPRGVSHLQHRIQRGDAAHALHPAHRGERGQEGEAQPAAAAAGRCARHVRGRGGPHERCRISARRRRSKSA